MSSECIALLVTEKDNVATVFANNVKQGMSVKLVDRSGNTENININNDVPYGHKFAVKSIKKGEIITKYGEEIGIATADINKGDYVHVHNLDSMRGRGDWEKEK